ncbi:chorismate mutase [Treponema sp.]
MDETKLFALRAAICTENTEAAIQRRVAELYDEVLAANNLREEGIVSLIFSITSDLDALNPAAALRRSGRGADLALFSVAEPEIKGALGSVIRLLIHCYLPVGTEPRHLYRNGAEVLRPDRK